MSQVILIFFFLSRNSIVHNGIKLLEYNRFINSQLHEKKEEEEEEKKKQTLAAPTTTTTPSNNKELMTLNEFLKEFQLNRYNYIIFFFLC
jgi:hypothetical protein